MDEETHKGGGDGSGRSWLGFLSVEYYQTYFDVTTSDVGDCIHVLLYHDYPEHV